MDNGDSAAGFPPGRRAGVGGRASSAGARQMSGACTLEGAPINLRALREHGKSALCDALDSVPGKKILVLDQSLAGCARTRTRTSRPQPTALRTEPAARNARRACSWRYARKFDGRDPCLVRAVR